jgi:hypothetical protein
MPGETWRELVQVGLETTYGTPVAATRQLLMDSPSTGLTRTRAAHIIKVSTGTRDNVRGVKNRAVAAGGSFKQTLDADEIIEPLLACIQGGVTPTASAAVANPTTAATATPASTGGVLPAGTYTYVYTDVAVGGAETAQSSASTGAVCTGSTSSVALTGILAGATGTLQRRLYRQLASGGYGLIATINDNTTTTYSDTGAVTTAASLANGAPPAANQTGTGANVWVFRPSLSLDSQTWQWRDGQIDWAESGVYIDTIKVTWSAAANGDVMVDYTLFGKDRTQTALTGSLSTRSPVWIEGWQAAVYLDALGAAPGTTVFGTAISGTFTLTNKLGRKYFATNTQATGSIPFGEFDLTGDIVIEGNTAALVEYTDWDTAVPRMLRLAFGNSAQDTVLGASLLKRKVLFDIPCDYTAFDLSGADAGTKIYKASFQYQYDAQNGYSFQATAVNSRSAAYV